MLESIFNAKVFFVGKGKKEEIIFASDLSSPIKTHTVKLWVESKKRFKYVNLPCEAGAIGLKTCRLCAETKNYSDFIYDPRKIYVATIYYNSPWTDRDNVSHAYSRALYVVTRKSLKNTIGPYMDKYQTIMGAKFEVMRGDSSVVYIGDLYNFKGFVPDIAQVIGERPRPFNVEDLFSPLSKSEMEEVMASVKMGLEQSRSGNTAVPADNVNNEEIPF